MAKLEKIQQNFKCPYIDHGRDNYTYYSTSETYKSNLTYLAIYFQCYLRDSMPPL